MKQRDTYDVLLWAILLAAAGGAIYLLYRQTALLGGAGSKGAAGFDNRTAPSEVRFLTQKETAAFLAGDVDGYMSMLSPIDLYARGASLVSEYAQRSAEAARGFSGKQEARVREAASLADAFFRDRGCSELDRERLLELPWVVALTAGTQYEEGLAHTRANVIFLSEETLRTHPSAATLAQTLAHEKIHLYQRMYPEETAQTLNKLGYQRWKMRLGEPRVRANPDLDPYIYIDPRTREPMMARYTSDQPSGIQDVELTNVAFEHPLELMAYEIASRM